MPKNWMVTEFVSEIKKRTGTPQCLGLRWAAVSLSIFHGCHAENNRAESLSKDDSKVKDNARKQ